jgi:beta-glucanase (GH16 family)
VLGFGLLVGLLPGCAPQTPSPSMGQSTVTAEWQLVWSDEFDYTGLPDPTRWSYDVGGHGWGNQELQFYTERRLRNARVENGRLIIEAHREEWEEREYTSARLVTRGKGDWTYGRFEVRARLPSGRGTWPAIWMLASQRTYGDRFWPDNGEIDIMEHVGWKPDTVHAAIHTRAYHHSIGTHKVADIHVPTARSEFHVYALEWTPRQIRAYVDDRHYFTFANERLADPTADYRQWPFDQPFHLILNIAVGGTWGGARGVDPAIWPQRMEVDYVRVYTRGD